VKHGLPPQKHIIPKKGTILYGRRYDYFQSKKGPSKIHHNVMKVRRRDDCDDNNDDDVSSLLDMTLQGVVVAQCLHVFVKLRLAECFVEENHHEPYEQQQTTISSVSHKQSSRSSVRESGGSPFEPTESCSSVPWSSSSSLSSSFTCRSLDYLAQYSSSHADRLLRILRVLCINDIVRELDDLTFSLSRKGQALLVVLPPPNTNHSSSSSSQSKLSAASSMIQYLLDSPIWNSWNFLTDYVLEEEDAPATLLSSSTTTTNTTSGNDKDAIAAKFSRGTPFEQANHKLTTQEYYSTHPMALHNANRFVGYMFDWETKELACHHFWNTVTALVDIGGYKGGTIQSIQAQHAHLIGQSYCIDLPGPIAQATRQTQNNNNNASSLLGSKDVVFRAADILNGSDCSTVLSTIIIEWEQHRSGLLAPSSDGTSTTVFLLKHMILCEFNETDSLHILQQCHEAMPGNGRVVIVESIILVPGQHEHEHEQSSRRPTTVSPAMVDVFLMMDGRPERSRSVSEWSEFVGRVGYEIDQVYPTSCPTCALLVLRKTKR
jgi:hypothetical protein